MAVITAVPVPKDTCTGLSGFREGGWVLCRQTMAAGSAGFRSGFLLTAWHQSLTCPTFPSPPVLHVVIGFSQKVLLPNLLQVEASLNHVVAMYIFRHFVRGDLQKRNTTTAANVLELCLELWKPVLAVGSVSAVTLLLVAFQSPLSAL